MEVLPLKNHDDHTHLAYSNLEISQSLRHRSCNSARKKPLLLRITSVFSLIIVLIGVFTLFQPLRKPFLPNSNENLENVHLEKDFAIPFKIMTHPLEPLEIWGDLQKPFPTGAWWLNLALEGGDVCAVPQPYGARLSPNGMVVSNPLAYRVVSQKAIQNGCGQDLTIGASDTSSSTIIQDFDELSVSMKFAIEDQGDYIVHLVAGSPAIATEYNGVVPMIQAGPGLFSKVNGESEMGTEYTGTSFSVELPTSVVWNIFSSEEITFVWDKPGSLTAKDPFTGVIQVAVCTLPTTCDEMAPFMSTYAVGGTVLHEIEGDSAKIKYQWKVKGDGNLLMLAAPHHMEILESPVTALERHFLSMKGPLVGVVGDTWVMHENLTTISWTSPLGIDTESEWGQAIQEQLPIDAEDVMRTMIAPDPYGFGKQIGKAARLALIAEEFGQIDLSQEIASAMEGGIARWLKDSNQDYLVYDETWGGVVSSNGIQDSAADFGNGWYNDHHFQYGYFAYAMAVVQHVDPTFHHRHGNHCDFLVADIATLRSNSTQFPKARHKDFWAFHSWADGLFPQGDGKNEESSTEAINAYYGVALYGEATGNTELRDWGRLLLAMEIRATHKYWHMVDDSVYDDVFAVNRMVGNIGSLDARDATWFGDNHVYVHGINMMPFTPITEEVLTCNFVLLEYEALEPYIDGAQPQWQGFSFLDHAVIDQKAAWEEFNTLDVLDDGLSKTNGMYWIATRPPCTAPANFTVEPAVISAECAANSACFGMGMTDGNCCPTATGAFLGCCPQGISYPAPSLPEGNCAQNDKCAAMGFGGDCCPAKEGVYLGCCSEITPVTHAPLTPPVQGTCSSDPGCAPLGLQGDCCPTAQGTYLGCCSSSGEGSGSQTQPSQGTCSTDPGCSGLGLEGDCCPTAEGTYLGCCSSSGEGPGSQTQPSQGTCSTDPGCSGLGLEGDCCPTAEGIYLGCCLSTQPLMAGPTDAPQTQPPQTSSCAANPNCVGLGLQGECCPTEEGVILGCCSSSGGPSKPVGTCSSDPGCSALGLTGDCCPGSNGVYLGCCSKTSSASTGQSGCSAHPACKDQGLTGECCPTEDGTQLECCSV